MSQVAPLRTRDADLWDEFVQAKRKVEETWTLEDALACRRAWMNFIYATEGKGTDATVLQFPGGRNAG